MTTGSCGELYGLSGYSGMSGTPFNLYEVYFNEYFYIPKTYVDLATPDSVFVAANSSNLTIKFSPSTLSSNIKYYGLTVLINYESNISNQQRQYDTIFEIKPFID